MLDRSFVLFFLLCPCFFLFSCRGGEQVEENAQWIPAYLPEKASLRGMSTPLSGVVWVGGSGGALYLTRDRGQHWDRVSPPETDSLDFRDIEAFDDQKAVAMSAGPGDKSRIYRTENGGQTWIKVYHNDIPEGFFNAIAFWNDWDGLLTGDPIDGKPFLLQTGDGGKTWDRIPPENIPDTGSGEYGFAASGTHLAVTADTYAWLGTGGTRARVFKSSDGGEQWEAFPVPLRQGNTSSGIFSLYFEDANHGIAVGGDYQRPELKDSTIAVTLDGGMNWALSEGGSPGFRSAVKPITGGWIIAGSTGSDYSINSGKTWNPIDTLVWNVLGKGPAGQIWVAGSEGKVARLNWE